MLSFADINARVVLTKDVTKMSSRCHGMVIAIFLNAITEMTTKQENIMELLDMRDDCLIDEWADYEDYDYADDAVEL
jgi:hypothetical protein